MPMRRWLWAKAPVAASERAVARRTRRTNSLMMSSNTLGGGSVDPVEIVIVVVIFSRAEFAFHRYAARSVAQVVELLALDAAQHAVDALAAAAATRDQWPALE